MTAQRLRSIVGAVVLCALLCSIFVFLGQWQWRVAFANQQRLTGVVASSAVPLNNVSPREQWLPRTSMGALVTVTGKFDDTHTFITSPRPTSQGKLPWVVTPLQLADGTAVAVVTGFTDMSGQIDRVTPIGSGELTITARMQPSEDSPAVGTWQPAQPELSTNSLVDRWPYPVLRDGYLVTTQSLTMSSIAAPTPRFTSAPSGSIGWRSIAYAFQWWSFAAFTFFVFIRQVATRPHRDEDEAAQ